MSRKKEEQEEFNDDVSEADIDALIQRTQDAEAKNMQLSRAMNSIETQKKEGNFLHLQISTQEMLDKLEHFYKGDVKVDNENGTSWETQKNKDLVTFNEYGATSIMEIVTKYIDRNTILSDYSEQRIYEILGDIGDELTLFILCNYEKIGMDTYFKKTKFRIIVITTLHIIESTYRRALRGKTLEEMNQSRVVGQFGDSQMQHAPQMRKRGYFEKLFG